MAVANHSCNLAWGQGKSANLIHAQRPQRNRMFEVTKVCSIYTILSLIKIKYIAPQSLEEANVFIRNLISRQDERRLYVIFGQIFIDRVYKQRSLCLEKNITRELS